MADHRNPRRRWNRPTLLFFSFATVAVATGVLSPHFAWEHFPFSPATGQTLIIAADFLLLALGFSVYLRAIRREERERRRAESHLVSSYRYIGVANRKLELLCNFADELSTRDRNDPVHDRIGSLLPELVAPFAKVNVALLRIVDRNTGKTQTEWWYHRNRKEPKVGLKIGNREIVTDHEDAPPVPLFVVDRPAGVRTIAVLAADRPLEPKEAKRFLQTAVRLLHLSSVAEKG